MKSRAFIGLLLLSGCVIHFVDEKARTMPPSKITTFVRQVRYVNSTATELNFEVDLYHEYGYNFQHEVLPQYFFNWLGPQFDLDTAAFVLPSTGEFILKGSGRTDGSSIIPSSGIILEDESGSYDTLDEHNDRSRGVTKLCQDFTSPSQILIGGFSSNGSLDLEPITFFSNSFSPYSKNMMPFIFDLASRTGGKSNLYDALNSSLDKLIASGTLNQNIIVLAHANDSASTNTLDDVVTKATANNIQIHIIFRGQASEANPLAKLAESTKGSFVFCPSVGEMVCAFENLYSILAAADQVYRLKVKYVPTSGTITSDQEFWFNIKVHVSYLNSDSNPAVVYVKVP